MNVYRNRSIYLLLLALLLGACSPGGARSPEVNVEPASFTVDMHEYTFSPEVIEVQVGQEVTLKLINQGALVHELMIGREVVTEANRPSGYAQDLFETGGVTPQVVGGEMEMGHAHGETQQGFMLSLHDTGQEATLTFTVTEAMVGEWEMGCFEQDGVHYDAGMKGRFVVVR